MLGFMETGELRVAGNEAPNMLRYGPKNTGSLWVLMKADMLLACVCVWDFIFYMLLLTNDVYHTGKLISVRKDSTVFRGM